MSNPTTAARAPSTIDSPIILGTLFTNSEAVVGGAMRNAKTSSDPTVSKEFTTVRAVITSKARWTTLGENLAILACEESNVAIIKARYPTIAKTIVMPAKIADRMIRWSSTAVIEPNRKRFKSP